MIKLWTITAHPEVRQWISELDDPTYTLVQDALEVLSVYGPALGRPLADKIAGSSIHNPKELRPGSAKDSEVRVLFVFDPDRRALLLVAGNKAGERHKWYRRSIQLAEQRYTEHLSNMRGNQP